MPKSIAKLKEEQAKIQDEINKLQDKEAMRIGKIALDSGVLDLNISDAEWKKVFQDTADNFRKKMHQKQNQEKQTGEAQSKEKQIGKNKNKGSNKT